MVLELITLVGLPAVVATAEGIRQHGKNDQPAEPHCRMKDFHIDVYCNSQSRKRVQVDQTMVVMSDGKLYLAAKDSKTKTPLPLPRVSSASHPFTSFFLDFEPDQVEPNMFERLNRPPKIRGLVSTISVNPPILNWIFVDRNTFEVKYGSRAEARGHLLGPWDWTDDKVGIMLEN
ncbi:hypothetical protein EJ08DRAFT_258559 [Tothia fuscella]|uniref:Uncharacterized protein n=1 Tax=Tothia fuscella TaxID=1048955 RepID=A0A9P4NQY1_9PEZI|nr:hypothetical protein EJ08DRAFT_258559 [Tothia fuscella]